VKHKNEEVWEQKATKITKDLWRSASARIDSESLLPLFPSVQFPSRISALAVPRPSIFYHLAQQCMHARPLGEQGVRDIGGNFWKQKATEVTKNQWSVRSNRFRAQYNFVAFVAFCSIADSH
jgi:hypothetical protein